MDKEKIHQAEQSILELENFMKNLMSNIEKTIDAKIQQALQEQPVQQINITKEIDERFNQNLSNFLKQASAQLSEYADTLSEPSNPSTNVIPLMFEETHEDNKEEPDNQSEQFTLLEEPDIEESPAQPTEKQKQYETALTIIKNQPKKTIRLKELTRILKSAHGIDWVNPTNELIRMMKSHPIKRLGYGEYKYIGE